MINKQKTFSLPINLETYRAVSQAIDVLHSITPLQGSASLKRIIAKSTKHDFYVKLRFVKTDFILWFTDLMEAVFNMIRQNVFVDLFDMVLVTVFFDRLHSNFVGCTLI